MRGRLKAVNRDVISGKYSVTFEVDTLPAVDDLDGELEIEAKVYREKRSLNANSYFHVLAGKIAAKLNTSNTHEKNRLIREYGQWEIIDGLIPTITVKPEYEDLILDVDGLHVKPTGKDENGRLVFGLMRGSHTYNTKEMARLIDGTVEDAKELGIETLTPAELERMKSAWSR